MNREKRTCTTKMHVSIGTLRLRNPVLVASGCFGDARDHASLIAAEKLGGIVTKSTTLYRRRGAPPPRIVECASGMLNAIGLENPGLTSFLRDHLPRLRELKTKKIVSIAGTSTREYEKLAAKLCGQEGVDAIEINISCPNFDKGLLSFGHNPLDAARLVSCVRKVFVGPLIVKLSPNTDAIVNVAVACQESGADALSLVNTFIGLMLDWRSRRPLLGNITGGLSGPCIKPLALRMVWEVARKVQIPVIGIGGISTAQDALEFMVAGARAVQIGSVIFANPRAPVEIAEGMKNLLVQEGIPDVNHIVGSIRINGSAHPTC